WYAYLKLRRRQVRLRCVTDPAYEEANNCHERALVFMHKMPRIWLDYCQFLVGQGRITRTRRTFDRALRALPITQHHRLWPLYLRFVRLYPLPETAVRVYRRYLKLCPEGAEQYVQYLRSVGRLDEAAQRLAALVNDERFVSAEGKSKYQLWQELCDLISQHPERVRSLDAGAIIRGGLRRFTDHLGRLWCALADCYIRSGHFEKVTPRGHLGDTLGTLWDVDLELRLARLERLVGRRPLLLNSVLLRQNPHNVHEWHKRVRLHHGNPQEIISTYTQAVRTVDPMKATGPPHSLWVAFARFYEDNGQLDDVRGGQKCHWGGDTPKCHPGGNGGGTLWCWGHPGVPCAPSFHGAVPHSACRPQPSTCCTPSWRVSLWGSPWVRLWGRPWVRLWVSPWVNPWVRLWVSPWGSAPRRVPPAAIYLLYAKLEEEFGLARHAMAVYERATRAVLPAEQREMFNIYIKRAAELYGVTHTRPIYEKAIEVGTRVSRCLRCPREPHGVTLSPPQPPQITANFWQTWKDFEIRHGNEDTIREMLRIKRSVQATYNTQVNFMASQMLKVYSNATGT
uniref:XPA binding protein 2 n=1 Tax=Anas zonorhyncha TaxID=75864 RepID=A0A8B9V8V9_9AVES